MGWDIGVTKAELDAAESKWETSTNEELMIDIESMGTKVGCPVLTIGAVLFDPRKTTDSAELIRRSLLIRIDVSDAVHFSNLGVDGKTLRWWLSQDDAALKALIGDDAVSLKEALERLHGYCHDRGQYTNGRYFDGISQLPRANRFWAKDPDFDMSLMQFYYDHPDIHCKSPWSFWACRSVRTMQDLAWPNGPSERPSFEIPGVAHDARWDAVQQAMTVQAAYLKLGLSLDNGTKMTTWKGVGNE